MRLKADSSAEALKGAEGLAIEVLLPEFDRYHQDGKLMFVYQLDVHQIDPDTFKPYGRTIINAYEDRANRRIHDSKAVTREGLMIMTLPTSPNPAESRVSLPALEKKEGAS